MHNPLVEVIDRLGETAENGQPVSVRLLRQLAGERIAGPLLFFPAMVIVSPLSLIPLLPTTIAVIVILVSLQVIAGRRTIWLPGRLLDASLSVERSAKVIPLLRRAAGWIGKVSRPRLGFLVDGVGMRLGAFVCMLVALTMPPLELVPMASTTAGTIISIFGLAITMRDGVLMLFSLGLVAVAAWFVTRLLLG